MSLYSRRTEKRNVGGMRIDHSFALWYTLRMLQPTAVIESGAQAGLSTWLIRNAVPKARIFSLDPSPPRRRLPGVEYFVKGKFVDFAAVNWSERGVTAERTVVFVDDHQSAYRRIFKVNQIGFKHFIIEDNYPYLTGDALSLKTACEVQRRRPGSYKDNFGRLKVNQTWEEHINMARELDEKLLSYYEFPPLVSPRFVVHTVADDWHTSTPIVKRAVDFERHFGDVDMWQFEQYKHIAYAHIK